MVLNHGISPKFRGGVHFCIQTVIGHRVSPEFIGLRNCAPMAFTAESPPAQGHGPVVLKVVPVMGAAFHHHEPIDGRLLFLTSTVMLV